VSENGKLVSYGNSVKDYSTDVLAHKAYDFIEINKNTNQPFFMYLAPFAPHAPLTPATRHLGKFRNLKFLGPLYEVAEKLKITTFQFTFKSSYYTEKK
jgi:arylsulfatase A-like enzyme